MLPWACGVTWRVLGKTWSTLELFRYPDGLNRDKSSPSYSCSLVTSQRRSRGPWRGTGEVGNAIGLLGTAYSRLILVTTA